jgi:hypothetical protein
MVAAGCHSELELWGHAKVMSDERLPRSRAQVRVVLPSGVVYLDRYSTPKWSPSSWTVPPGTAHRRSGSEMSVGTRNWRLWASLSCGSPITDCIVNRTA